MKKTTTHFLKSALTILFLFGFLSLRSQTIQPSSIPTFSTTNGQVNAIVWDSTNNAIYIGGTFTQVGGQARMRFAAINATTGALLPWNVSFNNDIKAMYLHKDMLYVGGLFTTVAASPRTGAAKFKTSTQTLTSWAPNPGNLYSIIAANNYVYMGGIFFTAPSTCLVRSDTSNAAVKDATWTPNSDNVVYDFAVDGNILYVGGNFSNISGVGRTYLAAYDISVAVPPIDATWAPAADNSVYAVEARNGFVYVAGTFQSIGIDARGRFACLDPVGSAGAATALDIQFPNTVYGLASKGNMLYIAGPFWNALDNNSSITYNNAGILEYDLNLGAITKYNPSPGSSIQCVATGQNKIYVGESVSPNLSVYCANFMSSIYSDISFIYSAPNICAGQTIAVPFSVDNVSGATSYDWSNSLSGISIANGSTDSVMIDFSGAAAGSDNVNVYGTNGCINTNTVTTSVNVYQFTSEIGALSTGLSATINGQIICGESDTLWALYSYPQSGTVSFSWAPAGTLNAANLAIVYSSAKTNTTYTLSTTTTDGCSAMDTMTLFVNNFDLTIGNFSPTILCSTTDTLSVTDNYPGAGTVTYTWSPSASLNLSNPAVPVAQPVSTTNYTVIASASDGCIANAQTTIVFVNGLTLTSSAVQNNITCGNSTQLSTSSDYPGAGTITYTWSPSGDLSNANIINPVASPTTTTNYSIDISTPEGCSASDVIAINVNSLQVTTANSIGTTCGNPVTLTTGNNSGNINLVYSWSPAAGLSNANVASPSANPGVTTIYTVTMSLPSTGCAPSSEVDTVKISPPAIPSICMLTDSASTHNVVYWDKTPYATTDKFIIYREVTTNTYVQIGVVPHDSLSQFIDTAQSIGPSNGNPNIGTYRYKIAVQDSCGNISGQSPFHNTIFFVDNHTGTFTWNVYTVENMTVTPVTQFDLERDNLNNGIWTLVGSVAGTQTTLNDPQYSTYNAIANWRVQAQGFSCTPTMRGSNGTQAAIIRSKSNITNNRGIGIKTNNVASAIEVYPNPTNGTLVVSLGNISNGKTMIKVISMLGEEVYGEVVNSVSDKHTIDLSKFQNGTYVVQITTDNSTVTKRIIKN